MANPEIIWQLADLKVQDLGGKFCIAKELYSEYQLDLTIPAWIDREITLGQVLRISMYGCLDTTYQPMNNFKTVRLIMLEYGDEIIDYLASKLADSKTHEVWTYQPHDFSGKMLHLFALTVEIWASNLILGLTDDCCLFS